ncbi:hypothetical protein EYF80_042192 [Liparis tanakae]|uniref:Uncharacterized protein n=1 Tax=Liparis tanakae TaxID=230148 RepID=A0A4Z2G223_9TELE|nr:hypothetical protein EYF80_042192 [Liparis tanakae]
MLVLAAGRRPDKNAKPPRNTPPRLTPPRPPLTPPLIPTVSPLTPPPLPVRWTGLPSVSEQKSGVMSGINSGTNTLKPSRENREKFVEVSPFITSVFRQKEKINVRNCEDNELVQLLLA